MSVYSDLSAADVDQQPTQIESLCQQCGENGTTTMMLTKIPHYREIILMAFNCDHCGFANNETQSGQSVQSKGVEIELQVGHDKDLRRQVVKGDHGTIRVPELDLEIPPESQKGSITTVEGVLKRTAEGLAHDQPVRKHTDPKGHDQIETYLGRINAMLDQPSFTLKLIDPSGNSHIENPNEPHPDPVMRIRHFKRSAQQDTELCIYPAQKEAEEVSEFDKHGVMQFATNCPSCQAPAVTNMRLTDIPHFKETVIMATNCDSCGHRSNEVKGGGGIEPKGCKIVLDVTNKSVDLTRDLIKSETCSVQIPELEMEMGAYAISGRFTTVEGMLDAVHAEISSNPFLTTASDSLVESHSDEDKVRREKIDALLARLVAMQDPSSSDDDAFTIILDDPAGNSYIQSLCEDDPQLKTECYERSEEQNDELGLLDMKTEDYS